MLTKGPASVLFVAFALVARFQSGHGANILFYTGICTASHVTSFVPVLDRLAELGHNVTLHTPYVPKKISSKVTILFAEDIYKVFRDQWDTGADLIGVRAAGISLWDGILDNGFAVCKMFFDSPKSQALIHNSKFDLVIVDSAFNDCGVGLAALKYKCPHIMYSPLAPTPNFYDEYGLPFEAELPDMESWVPVEGGDEYTMSFWDRLEAIWLPLKILWRRHMEYYPKLNAILKEHLQLTETPDISSIVTRPNLVFMNTHYSSDYVRSLPPLYVPIGGVGISEERKPLPKELETFISRKGSQGFVFVCFGGAVQIAKSSPELRAKLFSTFASFPDIQFVWKWEGEVPMDDFVPENIYFSSWLPQQDLFADKRIKGFIGHGGMNGVLEAIHFAVPQIIFPVMGDQDQNGKALAAKGLATMLEVTRFEKEQLIAAINRMLNDKGLRERTQLASRIARDRPQKPLDAAVWWVEYVLRHKDTTFLLPPSSSQPWYKKRLLDIWFTVFAVGTVVFFVLVEVLFWLLRGKTKTVSVEHEGYKNGTAVSNGSSKSKSNGKTKKS